MIARTVLVLRLRRKTSTAVRMTEAHVDRRETAGLLELEFDCWARLKAGLSEAINRNKDSKIL
jgi:hypothetical protein